jgi:Holliday junction resolvase
VKSKGSRTERELVQLFNQTEKWAAIRVAGSGLTKDPNPDVLAGNKERHLAIECKSIKSTSKYLYPEDMEQIIQFAEKFGAEPWFAIRFNNKGWFFLKPHQLEKTKSSNLCITLKLSEQVGVRFEELIGGANYGK